MRECRYSHRVLRSLWIKQVSRREQEKLHIVPVVDAVNKPTANIKKRNESRKKGRTD